MRVVTPSHASEENRVVYDVLTMGRSCIDLYAHQIGVPITEVTSFDAYVGGCPTNISVGTRRLGLRSALLTAVGDDQVADFVLAFLRREGVETRFIPRKPGRRTSAVIMAIQPPDRFPQASFDGITASRNAVTCVGNSLRDAKHLLLERQRDHTLHLLEGQRDDD